ncbi:MAG: condensation domain-containing protein, partial [Mycobacteriales bacterium]
MSRDIADIYPLTSMQQGMLIESLTAPADRPVYLQHYDLQVTGVPAPNVLLAGFADIAARYDVLRTSFIWDVGDTPLQVVRREVVVPVDVTDLRGSAGEVDSAVADALDAEGARAFDLDRAPLLRARAFRLSADSWRLVTTHHHLVLDGWSVPIVHAALVDAWRAHVAGRPLPASPAGRFREFVGWQRSTVDDAHDERYFTDLLGDVSTATPLGPELPPGLDEGGRSTPGRVTRTLDVDPARHPDARAPVAGVLPSTLVHAAWALTLARWADVDDVVFGSTVSGRATELADAAGRVGMFVNTAPVRITVPDADVGRYLAAVARRLDQARRHDQSSVAVAARCSSVGSGQALLSSVLAFQNYWRPDHEAIGSTDSGPVLRVRQRVEHTDLPVAAAVALPGSGVWVRLDYDRSRVGDDTARRLADTCAELVVELATAPAQTPLGALAAGPSGTVGDQPAATRATVDVVAALRAQALARPDHDALTGPGGPMSFRALSSVVSRAGGTDDSGPIIVRAPYDVEAAAALVAAAATGRAVTLVDTYASAAEQTERRFPGPAEQAARIVDGCALVIESVGLTPSDRVAIADGSALSGAGVIVAAVCAGASVQLEAAAPTDATVVVGGPLAVSDLVGSASPQCRVVITGEPPPCAVLAALLDAGHRCYRVVAHHDSGTIVGCGALRRAELARDLARIDGGICLDRAGRAATPDASGELAVRAPDGVLRLGIRCRAGAGGTVEQLGLGPDDDTVWAESIIGCDDAVKAAAFGADRVLWLVASRAGPDLTALDRRLRARLPERLRPTGYQVLGRLPVTTDGRADRAALIATTGPGVRAAAGGSPPDPLADRLAELPDSTRGRVVDALRAAAARTPGLRHSVRDRVAVSAQQQQWASAEPVLRDHGRYPLREPERAELEAAIRVGTIAPDAAPIGTTAEGASYATVPPGALDLPAVAGLVAGVRPTGQLTAADYASWQTDGARASHRARQLAGWRDALAGLDRSGLQLDGQPDAATGVNEVTVAVPGGCADVDTWVAATAVALAHLAGSDDVTVGVVTRPALPIELDGVPGPFARMLPVRVTVGADDDFATVRATAGTALAQARARGEVPWPDLAALLPEVPPVSLAVHHRAGALAAHAGTPLALDVAPIHQGVLVTALADTSLAHPELARRVAGLAAAVVLVGSRDAHGPISPADLIVDDAGCGRVGELLRRGDGGPG